MSKCQIGKTLSIGERPGATSSYKLYEYKLAEHFEDQFESVFKYVSFLYFSGGTQIQTQGFVFAK
jgi:hypothetical protein